MAKKLCNKYPELINIIIPEIYKSKDFSDLYKNHQKLSIKIINNMINNAN